MINQQKVPSPIFLMISKEQPDISWWKELFMLVEKQPGPAPPTSFWKLGCDRKTEHRHAFAHNVVWNIVILLAAEIIVMTP